MQAVLGEKVLPLKDILSWKKGTQIMFNVTPEDRVEMRCGDFPIYKGTTGQKKGHIAVRVDSYVEPKAKGEEEF